MTDAQKQQLDDASAALRGVQDFLNGDAPPAGAKPERVKMYRALTRASNEPKAGDPGEHTHPAHTHRVGATGPAV